jgi:protease I
MTAIDQARILIMATDGFEQSELLVPRDRLREAGATVEVATPDGGEIRGWDETDWGNKVPADLSIGQARIEDYDALVLPGGQINPDKLRTVPDAVKVVRQFLASGRIVAAICHGPWLLVEADGLRGRDVTSFPSIRTDVVNAGGNWIDREVVVDQGIITSRSPKDLDAFVAKIVEEVQEGRHPRAA